MKYYELYQMNQQLQKLSVVNANIPWKTGIKIARNAETIRNTLIPIDKMRNDIISKYSDGKMEIAQDDEHYHECTKDIDALMNQEVTNMTLEKIEPSELDGFNLPMNIITALYPMLEQKEGGD